MPKQVTGHDPNDPHQRCPFCFQTPAQDFSGFRIVLLYPRDRNMWPAPNGSKPQPRADPRLGAPLDPWPGLQIKGRPLSAATIRAGPGYLEVPFVATHENKRGRGFGRCLVEAIEEISRALKIERLLLCSTLEEHVKTTWRHLGFVETTDADLEALDVRDPDLVHMQVGAGSRVGEGGSGGWEDLGGGVKAECRVKCTRHHASSRRASDRKHTKPARQNRTRSRCRSTSPRPAAGAPSSSSTRPS
jgi:GNAT superfamily N-acetyltransferase